MLYPVYVHVGDKKHAHGIEFPDFPGCFSAADDWQEINRMAQEPWNATWRARSCPSPPPTALEKLAADPRYEGGVWMLVDLDYRASIRRRSASISPCPAHCSRRSILTRKLVI